MAGVITFDLSLTRTGVCRVSGNGYATETLKPPAKISTGIEKLVWYADAFRSIAQSERPGVIGIENYAMGGAGQKFRPWAKGELGGVCRVEFARVNSQIVLISPKVAKKFATGRGDAEKTDVSDYMRDALGAFPCKNEDEGDAAALAYFVQAWLRPKGLEPWRYELLAKCEVFRTAAIREIRTRTRGQNLTPKV